VALRLIAEKSQSACRPPSMTPASSNAQPSQRKVRGIAKRTATAGFQKDRKEAFDGEA
jgi:hypothetical protein